MCNPCVPTAPQPDLIHSIKRGCLTLNCSILQTHFQPTLKLKMQCATFQPSANRRIWPRLHGPRRNAMRHPHRRENSMDLSAACRSWLSRQRYGSFTIHIRDRHLVNLLQIHSQRCHRKAAIWSVLRWIDYTSKNLAVIWIKWTHLLRRWLPRRAEQRKVTYMICAIDILARENSIKSIIKTTRFLERGRSIIVVVHSVVAAVPIESQIQFGWLWRCQGGHTTMWTVREIRQRSGWKSPATTLRQFRNSLLVTLILKPLDSFVTASFSLSRPLYLHCGNWALVADTNNYLLHWETCCQEYE